MADIWSHAIYGVTQHKLYYMSDILERRVAMHKTGSAFVIYSSTNWLLTFAEPLRI